MIIWKGLGILVPIVAILGIVAGVAVGGAIGQPGLGAGIGFALAALANWGLWKMIYPKTPQVLTDPATGRQIVMNPGHSLFFIPAPAWTWILAALAIPVMFIGFTGERAAREEEAKPGYQEFKAANELIGSSSKGETHGNTQAALAAAGEFSTNMKTMTGALFTGGSKKNFMTGGSFLTYCHEGAETIVFLCHVPSLRSYKSEEAKSGLNTLAWAVATKAAGNFDPKQKKTLIVGLRGVVSYGSVQSGNLGADKPARVQDSDEKSALIQVFAAASTAPAPAAIANP
jgi:hypothetical protein